MSLSRLADNGTILLNDVSLEVVAGESIAIVGPPGAGKTLLLRALAMLDPLDAGEVRFRGKAIAPHDAPAFRRDVLYVQQRPVLIEGTVRDNLLLPFSFRSGGNGEFDSTRVSQWLAAVERKGSFLDRSVADLSGGESQIVAILRALQLDPIVLLLDEPTSSLDGRTQEQIETLIKDWMTQPMRPAVVMVTHNEAQAERMADRIVRLQNGRIVEGGSST